MTQPTIQNLKSTPTLFSDRKFRNALYILAIFHLIIIASSNYLVQYPVQLFGINSTWGTLTFPFIFLATDLTIRIFNAHFARQIIFWVMLPALALSYAISVLFFEGQFQGLGELKSLNSFVARIALASFCAYAFGQLMDIFVFDKLRQNKNWWIAPSASSLFGNAIDTFIFFFIAFYQSSDAFMASHWFEIGFVDFLFKVIISLCLFVPVYGVFLNSISNKLKS